MRFFLKIYIGYEIPDFITTLEFLSIYLTEKKYFYSPVVLKEFQTTTKIPDFVTSFEIRENGLTPLHAYSIFFLLLPIGYEITKFSSSGPELSLRYRKEKNIFYSTVV